MSQELNQEKTPPKLIDIESVDAQRKQIASRKRDSTSAGSALAELDTSKAKRRKLSKLSALAAFEKLERDT